MCIVAPEVLVFTVLSWLDFRGARQQNVVHGT